MLRGEGTSLDYSSMSKSSSSENTQEDFYLESYAFTTAAAIVGSVDRKVTVLLRDGRNLFGILRTFDQYANLLLQDTTERIYLSDKRYAEQYHQVFLIRGENVVMLGELDIDKEDAPIEALTRIDYREAEQIWKTEQKAKIQKEALISKKMDKFGLTSEFIKSDLY